MLRSLLRSLLPLIAGVALAAPAHAGDVAGEWVREDGKGKVKFARCGDAICGFVSGVSDAKAPVKIGDRVFWDMKPSGDNAWQGVAFNPEDGRQYTGKMTLDGATLTTAGCVFGGWICKSFTWTRTP